jgi:hypothetical protein
MSMPSFFWSDPTLNDRLNRMITGTEMTGRKINTLRKLVEMLDETPRG